MCAGLLIYFPDSNAQLCTGNLGDPILNITFGDHYYPPLSIDNTDYAYAGGCPPPGEYTISSKLYGCGNNTWFLLAGDHTHNTAGNYMVVNAENKPGVVITNTVTGLCGNTTYEFAAWIMNVMQPKACDGNPVRPNLTFTVETNTGILLGTYNTGYIAETDFKEWNQYGLFFTTPANVNAVILSIKTNPPPGCGSSFALDDITLKACGPLVEARLDGNYISFIDVCTGYPNPFILNASYSPGFNDPVFQWQNSVDTGYTWQDIAGATTLTYSIPRRDSGIVLYRMVIAERVNFNSPQCRIASNPVWTNVHLAPIHTPTRDLTGCLDKNLKLNDPTYALHYHWTYPNGYQTDSSQPTVSNVQYSDTGLYKVVLSDEYGCSVADTFNLKVYPGTTVSVQTEQSICDGKAVQLSATGDGSYKWTPATGLSNDTIPNPYAAPHQFTQYKVVLTNLYGCKDSAFVNVQVSESLVLHVDGDKTIISGDSVMLDASVTGTDVTFYWSPPSFISDIHAINPKVFPPNDFIYTLYANSSAGCGAAVANVKVKVYNDLYIPNAFTPNGDGKNDRFRVLTLDDYKLLKFLIYNRNGQLVFKATNTNNGWDGRLNEIPQPIGGYVYYLELLDPHGKKIIKQGTFVLIR
jgi:gliding motility-associated-like protein